MGGTGAARFLRVRQGPVPGRGGLPRRTAVFHLAARHEHARGARGRCAGRAAGQAAPRESPQDAQHPQAPGHGFGCHRTGRGREQRLGQRLRRFHGAHRLRPRRQAGPAAGGACHGTGHGLLLRQGALGARAAPAGGGLSARTPRLREARRCCGPTRHWCPQFVSGAESERGTVAVASYPVCTQVAVGTEPVTLPGPRVTSVTAVVGRFS
mmetsp:Transcript_21469/g.63365  ORF Transcript_21469/g.63365 Transcript_21469/m.63365 type:complete len:210 (+) Transcript_21469:341-970(+)